MGAFQSYRRLLAPPWLLQPLGASWHDAHGEREDERVAGTKDAVLARWPSRGPTDALAPIGRDRALEQGPSEAEDAYRARLLTAFELWAWAGTRRGVLTAVSTLAYGTPGIVENWQHAPVDSAQWGRFWVTLEASPWGGDGHWGEPGGYVPVTSGLTWGSTATIEEVARVRRTIHLWRPAHAVLVGIVIVRGAPAWDTPAGLWSAETGPWGEDVPTITWSP